VSGDATTVTGFPVDFPDEAWSNSNGLWNGKVGDGAKLIDPIGETVDYVVVTGAAFENADYVRNYDVNTANSTYNPSEWTATPVELATDASPGSHSAAPPLQGPTISSISTVPELPVAGEGVDVTADVIDSTATITSVLLYWGVSDSSLPNEIGMSPSAGETYLTDTPIPSHSEGTTVYFQILAANDLPDTSITGLQSYSLPYYATIHEIQGESPDSPFDGEEVITHGVVTARFDNSFVIQDGSGPWNGIWVQSSDTVTLSDSTVIRGYVTESAEQGYAGNTLVVDAVLLYSSTGTSIPEPVIITTAAVSLEEYEGVLVEIDSAACTNPNAGSGEWELDDGSGAGRVGNLGYDFSPTLGSSYDIIGPVTYHSNHFMIEPRDGNDVVWAGDDFAPIILLVTPTGKTTIYVTFSEEVEETSAEVATNYTIEDLAVLDASWNGNYPDQIILTVSSMSEVDYTLTVNGVEDLFGNPTMATSYLFHFVDNGVPEGYYDSAEGLEGDSLKAALHQIIDDHTVHSYDYAWTAFYTTDDKPNGKVWDIYSDVPGGIPPYEYTFGEDEGGVGGQEGNGYTREHSWPKSWFGGDVSPMHSDLFALYPCDAHVNGNRGVYPYGEVAAPEWTSLNGSKRGSCSYPGYSGTVFEPIDEYKGDLARTYFYMSTRYYTEDSGWPGSPMTDGAELLPWAAEMLFEWHLEDPVSLKELDRNNTVFTIQDNRNPFIDRPEFAVLFVNLENTPPPVPVILLPENGDSLDAHDLLVWIEVEDPDPFNMVTYTLEIDHDSSFSSPEVHQEGIEGTEVKDPSVYVRLDSLEDYENLLPGAICYWHVQAVDDHGATSGFTSGDNYFISPEPPETIGDLDVKLAGGDIFLHWTEPYDNVGVASYVIYRNTEATSSGYSLDDTSDTTYTDIGTAGDVSTNYYYTVRAVDGAGNKSKESNKVGEFDRNLSSGQ